LGRFRKGAANQDTDHGKGGHWGLNTHNSQFQFNGERLLGVKEIGRLFQKRERDKEILADPAAAKDASAS
jgi:hypothetical protein